MRAIRIALVGIALLAGTQAARAQCVGDCDDGGAVTVNELVTGVNIALDRADLSTCPAFDADSSGDVAVNELVQGVNNLLRGCGPTPTVVVGTPTPTTSTTVAISTPTATSTVGDPTPTNTPGGPAPCVFTTADSSLRLCFLGICAAPMPISGELGVQCPAGSGSGGSALRECTCLFDTFNPVFISGVGYACVDEAIGASCPVGVQDCDGTASVNIDLVADTDIGSCSNNADCQSKCDTYCGALDPPKVRFSSGCESFCQAGSRLDLGCECDVLGGATCNPASTTDCPGGSCEGKDNEPDVDCHCQCTDEGFGDPTPAGALRCRLPTAIRVESGLPCDGNGVLVRLPPLCAPLTTGDAGGILLELNETPDPLEFDTLIGTSTTCPAIDAGDTSAMVLVANLGFFDSTIGDIISQLSINCQ